MDMSAYTIPKSDQMNADDLLAGPRTITITRVVETRNAEQPVAVYFEGDNNKPYKPGKSMRRVMMLAWGASMAAYTGRRMTLYCDPAVKFGGMEVGGIRISHMDGIDRDMQLALTVTKGKRAPYVVRRLAAEAPKLTNRERMVTAARAAAGKGREALEAFRAGLKPEAADALAPMLEELNRAAEEADAARGGADPDPRADGAGQDEDRI